VINEFLIKEFGDRIKSLRINHNLSQETLAHKTGFHRTYIGMIERGERNISLTNIAVFAKVFKMSISDLLNFNSESKAHKYSDYKTKSEL
jgi:transcriptional regulator with XRE-family HTH domain